MKTKFPVLKQEELRKIKGGGEGELRQSCVTVSDCLRAGLSCPEGTIMYCALRQCVCG